MDTNDHLDNYHVDHAARADLLERLDRFHDARDAYDRAIELTGKPAERDHLKRRRGETVRLVGDGRAHPW